MIASSLDLDRLSDVCRRHHVRSLDLFGSASTDRFDPDHSDLDFLVAFDDTPVGGFNGLWCRLQEDLERLFERKVDLVGENALTNPYFRRRVMATRRQLFPPP